MKKTMDIPRVETFPMHRGTIEHEIRRSIAKSLKVEYESCSSIDSLKSLDLQHVNKSYQINLIFEKYSKY